MTIRTTALPVSSTTAGADEVVINQGGATKRTLKSVLLGLLDFPVKIATAATNSQLALDANAGVFRLLVFSTGGLSRWALYADTSAETGGNAGSDLKIGHYADDGTDLGVALVISRKTGTMRVPPMTVAGLPSASAAGAGANHFVSDANATTFNSIAAGGGSNQLPVFSDGTNWRIG